jgi:hypothetical protein
MRRIIYNLNYFLHWLIIVKLRRHRYVSWHEIHNKGKFQNKKQVRSEKSTTSTLHYYLHLSFSLQPFWSISSLLQHRKRLVWISLNEEEAENAANYKSLLAHHFAFKEILCHSAHFKHKEVILLSYLTSFAITDIIGVVPFSVCRRNSRQLSG